MEAAATNRNKTRVVLPVANAPSGTPEKPLTKK